MSEFDAKRISPFKHLWKVDDKAWVKQRRSEAKYIEEHGFPDGTSKKDKKDFTKFYVKGEKEAYISSCELYFCVPVTSPEESLQLFNSDLFGPSERGDILTSYLREATDLGNGFTWLRQHVVYFVDGVLGHEYRYIEESGGRVLHVISPTPGFWCDTYMLGAIWVLSGEREYHACVDAVDYFVSALAYSDDVSYRHPKKFNKMMALVDKVLANENASEIAREFAETLKLREKEILTNWALHADIDDT